MIRRLVIGLVLLAAAIVAVAYGVLLTTIEDADSGDPDGVAQFIGGCFIAVGFVVAGVSTLVLRSANVKRRAR